MQFLIFEWTGSTERPDKNPVQGVAPDAKRDRALGGCELLLHSLLSMPTRLADGLGLRDALLQSVTLKIRPGALNELGSPAFRFV